MRPLYQTARDTTAEHEIADAISTATGAVLHKLPMAYKLDFVAMTKEGRFTGWLEVKDRYGFRWGQYPTVMLSVLKVQSAVRLTDTTGLPSYFVVRDSTGDIRAIDFDRVRGRYDWLEWGGRTRATRDKEDVEPVAHIPTGYFEPLNPEMF